jgi:hypothetical protein
MKQTTRHAIYTHPALLLIESVDDEDDVILAIAENIGILVDIYTARA